jgi:putative redox protein
VTFRVAFPAGEAGDAARAVLPDIVRQSHDRLCTVSRTIELGTPVSTRIE